MDSKEIVSKKKEMKAVNPPRLYVDRIVSEVYWLNVIGVVTRIWCRRKRTGEKF